MLILRHYERVPTAARGAVVAIGNFDGIHRGHQALIEAARQLARDRQAPLGLITFEPHPRSFFDPAQPPFRLTPFRVKTRLVQALGVDCLFVLRFDARLAGLTAEEFIDDVLARGIGVSGIVVGENFRFGHKRSGDVALLERRGRERGFDVRVFGMVSSPGEQHETYSSSQIRDYLRHGNPTRAALLLGRYWEIEGRVRRGAQRGRQLGFPTANLRLDGILRPAYGIYAVRVAIDRGNRTADSRAEWVPGVANLGISPMYGYEEPLLEVHLFDFDGDLYGRHLRVALIDYLRAEMTFDDTAGLRAQMAEDCRRARETLAWESWDALWPSSPFMATGGLGERPSTREEES